MNLVTYLRSYVLSFVHDEEGQDLVGPRCSSL